MIGLYYVRQNWNKPETEIKNTSDVNEACKICESHPGATVYNTFGKIIYSPNRGIDRRRKLGF